MASECGFQNCIAVILAAGGGRARLPWPAASAVDERLVVAVFKGNISALIPLYAFGVFTGFTLSQAGMVVHHVKYKEGRWRASLAINAVGTVATATVAIVVVVSKFTEGAWIPAVLIPAMVLAFRAVNKHYSRVREAVQVDSGYTPLRRTHLVVVLVGTVHRGVIEAVRYAKSLAPERLIAVSVVTDAEEHDRLTKAWTDLGMPIELHTIASPYRELTQPVLESLDQRPIGPIGRAARRVAKAAARAG